MFDLFYLHKAKKCLLIPVKQYVGVAWKTLGIKKNNKTRSPVAPLSLKIFELCASSERHPSCWELELENGELGLYILLVYLGQAACSSGSSSFSHALFYLFRLYIPKVGNISSSGHSTESPSLIRVFLDKIRSFIKSSPIPNEFLSFIAH